MILFNEFWSWHQYMQLCIWYFVVMLELLRQSSWSVFSCSCENATWTTWCIFFSVFISVSDLHVVYVIFPVFAPVEWLAEKVVSEMTYNVSSGTLNPMTLLLQLASVWFSWNYFTVSRESFLLWYQIWLFITVQGRVIKLLSCSWIG